MAKTKKVENSSGVDLLENPDALASKAEEFFNNKKNQNLLYGVLGLAILIVGGLTFFRFQQSNKNAEAQREIFQAIYYFEQDSLGRALNGDGNNYGFLDIIDQYSGTKAANLSSFYAGATYLKLGDWQNAIRSLEDFSSDDYLLQARAYSLVGDAYMELDDFENAISFYERASDYKPNKEFTPIYLQKLAIALEENGNAAAAADAYEEILEGFTNSRLEQEARKHSARLKGLAVE